MLAHERPHLWKIPEKWLSSHPPGESARHTIWISIGAWGHTSAAERFEGLRGRVRLAERRWDMKCRVVFLAD